MYTHVCMIVSDLLQNLDLALQDVSLIREVFHELLVSATRHIMNINRKHNQRYDNLN